MGNNSDKKLLFEAMHKVGGMPLNEDMYADDQVTQNFDNWHNQEQGPDMETNVGDEGMSSEELIVVLEKNQETDKKMLNKMDSNESWYNFFAQGIKEREKLINVIKQQIAMR